jgi:hypothetical protein
MRSFFTKGLVLLAATAWVASAAHAQLGPDPASLFPRSGAGVAPASPSVQIASYYFGPASTSNDVPSGNMSAQTEQRSDLNEDQHAPCAGDFDACSDDGCSRKWYAYAYGLAMTRNRAPAFWTTTTANDPFNLLMNTQNAGADWTGGGQVTVGYAWRGAGGPALAFTYWGLASMDGSASVSDATGNPLTALSSTLNFGAFTIHGNPGTFYFDNAQEQAIWRRDRTNNFEANLQSANYTVGSFQVAALAGFRYFRFTEDLTYGSASFGNSFVSNGGADAAYFNVRCHNDLFGGQVGAIISSILTHRVTAFVVPKVGIFGNQMSNQETVYSGDAVNTPVSLLTTHKSDVSVLSELDFGLNWIFNPAWRLTVGYRVVAVNNLSLADNQFAAYNHVEQSGSLILHGAFMGLGWMF